MNMISVARRQLDPGACAVLGWSQRRWCSVCDRVAMCWSTWPTRTLPRTCMPCKKRALA